MQNQPLNILIIDDHASIIEGYKSILAYNLSGFQLNIKQAQDCESAFRVLSNATPGQFDIVMLDLTLPPYPEMHFESGSDLVPVVRKHLPEAKIIILTSHTESLLLFRIYESCKPEGFLVKSDFTADELLLAFDTVAKGERYYTKTIHRLDKELNNNRKILDFYNQQILLLLSQGIKTKNLHEHLHLSVSAIDKRKVAIKIFFGIEKGSDEDIIREARKQGYI